MARETKKRVLRDFRIGVYFCECGPNIANAVELDDVAQKLEKLPEVSSVKKHKLLCSGGGKKFMKDDIDENNYTHIVVAACSPKDHEATFAGVCEQSGINPYLYKIVNIREQVAWMIKDKDKATDKVESYVKSAISRVQYQSPLYQKELEAVSDVLIIGGGIAGIEAALSMASDIRKVYLVEKNEKLGGKAAKLSSLLPHQGLSANFIQDKIKAAQEDENIEIFYSSELESAIGFFGNFEIKVNKSDEDIGEKAEFNVGSIIVATGFEEYDASKDDKFGLEKYDNILTAYQAEQKLDEIIEQKPKQVAMIHCVGREKIGYCSGICCNYLMKLSSKLKSMDNDIQIRHIYRDIVVPNKADEKFYHKLKQDGIEFETGTGVEVSDGNGVSYKAEDGSEKHFEADLVIMAPGMIPAKSTLELAEKLDIETDDFGFVSEEHYCLGSVNTSVDGVHVIGCAQSPRNIPDTIVQARAASGRVLSRLVPGRKLLPEVAVSEVIESLCTGCQTCVTVCSYGAATYDETNGISIINEAICRGCGNCVGSCPSGAVVSKHFTEKQLFQETIEAIIAGS
ncbi:MAG: CoB--CoM heterodisulfide reductase iron-sulfur subunit A family protein [Candidatus Zixiibacteriota bacterium]